MAGLGKNAVSPLVPGGARLTDHISLGVLAECFPRDLIEDVLVETRRREVRSRLLPAHVMVRFALAMCLFFDDDYEEVMRKLVESLKQTRSWRGGWKVPTTSAITQARQRLGADPLRVLFERAAVPVAGRGTQGAWCMSRRLMAIDGFVLDLADTPANVEEFGKVTNKGKAGPFPQAVVVGLGECGSRAVVAASVGGVRTGESTLMRGLLGAFEPDMLVLADRNFYGYTLWRDALHTGADLLWRVKSTVRLPVCEWLPDGSYRSVLIDPAIRGTRRTRLVDQARSGVGVPHEQAVAVRVVEYDVPDRTGNGTGELICLITSILDPLEASAVELATAYHQRWEFETGIDEKKTHLRGPGRILRSKSPEMVYQEIWAFLLTHYAIRRLMCRAADEADVDPDRLSFMRSVRIIRRQVTSPADFSP